ncbi:MAG: NAC family transcription factor, partial [Methanomicrobiales archaeon]|nr:NAC family transcription factor [Methanomicrobiales archaeon]
RGLNLKGDVAIRAELLRRTAEFNYIPTKKREAYADALLQTYKG